MIPLPKNLQVTGVSQPSILDDGFPVEDLLHANNARDLTGSIVGPYRNVSEYLDVHYNLLSEDFMGHLRDGLKEYKHKGCPDILNNNVRVFKEISFTLVSSHHYYKKCRYWYVNCVLDFVDKDMLAEPAFGSLLVFSHGDFDSDFFLGRVVSADKNETGKIVIEVQLKLPENKSRKELSCCHFTMIQGESYYMYFHVLKVLNLLSEQSFPMKRYIVNGTRGTRVSRPSYLTMFSSYKIFDLGFTRVLDHQLWPSCGTSGMDESQFSALKAALSKELAVVYGAPGTGKTYFGARLVEVFLDNMEVWDKDEHAPILIVCQSNEAIDNFMKNLLKYTDKIVRIGDHCQSQLLMPYSLKELVCRQHITISKNSGIQPLLDEIDRIRQTIQTHHGRLGPVNLASSRKQLETLEIKLHNIWKKLPNNYENSLQVLKSASVVGLTSTGAAAHRKYLEELKSPIVIIDEAGEMLEAHAVVSMTEHCRHLILLGDLKQLKPIVKSFHLGRDYNLNTSLFERLLTNEISEGNCLRTQYRMRPEISSLLKPHIYQVLHDSPVTLERENVRGLSENVFFLDHKQEERKAEQNEGCWNPHEVDMLVCLAVYLVEFQKYSPSDIAIITMYNEQKRKLIEARDRFPSLRDLEVACVDGYQGRENEIILLSLVRSNATNKIGFLAEENRICVALSRARSGLFIMGNMDCLRNNHLWNKVRGCLTNRDQIGSTLTLHCKEHQTSHQVSKLEDWEFKYCPSCSYETTKIGDMFDKPVCLDMDPSHDGFRRDYMANFRCNSSRDYNSKSCVADRTSGECGIKIFGLFLGAVTLCGFVALFWFIFGRNR